MDKISIDVKGGATLVRKLRSIGPAALQEGGASLFRSGEKIITRSKEEFVPIDTGALESTLSVSVPEFTKKDVVVTLNAGGPAAPYALAVHEIDKNYRNGRQWKYLETPTKEAVPDIVKDLKKDFDDLLRRVGRST